MSFVILKFSSGSSSHSKEKLTSYHVLLQGPPWSSHHFDSLTHRSLLDLRHSFILVLLADPQTCQKVCSYLRAFTPAAPVTPSLYLNCHSPESLYLILSFSLDPYLNINFHYPHAITLYPPILLYFSP